MYRRNFSPYVSKASSYLEALDRDEIVNNLRRQYAHYKSIQSDYDDLRYQIGKSERENKKLQEKNTQIQQDYLEKIKGNKCIITQLTYQIEDGKKQLQSIVMQIDRKQTKNENLISEIRKTKSQIEDAESENKDYDKYICEQENVIMDLKNSLVDLQKKKREIQQSNKMRSSHIDTSFENYKGTQQKLKMEEIHQMQLKKELSLLKERRQKLEDKSENNHTKMKDLTKKFDICQFESQKLGRKAQQLQKQMGKTFADSLTLKNSMKDSLHSNKETTERLKSLEVILKDNVNDLYMKKLKKQKLLVELANLMKHIEKTESTIDIINQQISQQQSNHNGLITNLKKSIMHDEEAVKTLTRKANILNLISH